MIYVIGIMAILGDFILIIAMIGHIIVNKKV
jgi:hypothetical protein